MYKKSKPGSVVECSALFTLPVVRTWPNTAKMATRVLRVAEKSGITSEKTNIRKYIFETLAKPNQKKSSNLYKTCCLGKKMSMPFRL